MTDNLRPAVAFAAKSTSDDRGSIPDQLADARTLAASEGLHLGAEFSDEAKSAYKGNRGAGLARAMAECERLVTEQGECALIVQHSDWLARGDGRTAKHLVEYALWALKTGVTIRSVQDSQTFGDLLYAVVTGQRNHEDSARKSVSVKDGLRRRKERGSPVGAMPLGYIAQIKMAEGKPVVDDKGKPISERVIDPATRITIDRIFDVVEAGATFGDVSRTLNAEGIVGRRGKPWVSRTVRTIVHNEGYVGRMGYPPLIEPERWQAIQDGLRRLDPTAVQRRAGGRKPADVSYFLRGIVFCHRCGGALYTRR